MTESTNVVPNPYGNPSLLEEASGTEDSMPKSLDLTNLGKYKIVKQGAGATEPVENPVYERRLQVNPTFRSLSISRSAARRKGDWVDFNTYTDQGADIKNAQDLVLDIIEVDPELRKEFSKRLASNIDDIRRFLVTDIAPMAFAFPQALEEATDTLRLLMDTSDITLRTDTVLQSLVRGTQIKLCIKLAQLLEIRPELLLHNISKDITLSELREILNNGE